MKSECITVASGPKPMGPYSPALRSGGMVFVSGQIGMDPSTGQIAVGVRAQAENSIRGIRALLEAAGLGLADVVKTTIFLADIADFAQVNEVYASQFSTPYPARSTFQVAALPGGALVEIEAIAIASK